MGSYSIPQQPYDLQRPVAAVMAVGQAANVAAALCCRRDVAPRRLDSAKLQDALIAQGVELRRGRPQA